jgi:hypothetical protein
MQEWPGDLAAGIAPVRRELTAAYDRADRRARHYRRLHHGATWIAALCGTAAVCTAILQLHVDHRLLHLLEPYVAAAALAAVLLGLWLSLMPQWILERHKAERLRMLKYDFLLRLTMTRDDPDVARALDDVRQSARAIEAMRGDRLDHWLEDLPGAPQAHAGSPVATPALRAFAEHYLNVRLEVHRVFFRDRSKRQFRFDVLTRYIPAACFFASIALVFVRFAAEAPLVRSLVSRVAGLEWPEEPGDDGRSLVLWASLLPVIGAGVRTVRGTFEFSRNTLRYEACHQALRDVATRLRQLLGRDDANAAALVGEIRQSEHVLEDEHREWLRLTKESEWFG